MVLTKEHISDTIIESYALGTLAEDECVGFEEHLLLCESCQNRLQQMDDFIHAFRAAAPRVEADVRTRGEAGWFERIQRFFRSLKPLHAAGALATVVLAVVLTFPKQPAVFGTSELSLTAVRGGSLAPVTAPAGHLLDMKLDLTAVDRSANYQIEIVDAQGSPEWRTEVAAGAGEVRIKTNKPLDAGDHWVRVYSGLDRKLLREYALHIK